MLAQAVHSPHHLNRLLRKFLKKDGFVILAWNGRDPSPGGPFEAWAYRGPLDLQTATPVTFGVGASIVDALNALERQLERPDQHARRAKKDDTFGRRA
jgi:hypothetical protein